MSMRVVWHGREMWMACLKGQMKPLGGWRLRCTRGDRGSRSDEAVIATRSCACHAEEIQTVSLNLGPIPRRSSGPR